MTVAAPPLPWSADLGRPVRELLARAMAAAAAAVLGHRHPLVVKLDNARGDPDALLEAGIEFQRVPRPKQRRLLAAYAGLAGAAL